MASTSDSSLPMKAPPTSSAARAPPSNLGLGASSSASSSSSAFWLMVLPSLLWLRCLYGLILALYVLQWFWPDEITSTLALTPGYFWPPHFYLWTALTHCLVEEHLALFILHGVVIMLGAKLLEPLWGPIEMLAFFVMINVGVALLSAFAYYILYMTTFNTELLFQIHVGGLGGYCSGILVSIKQAMPDHIIVRSPVKLTNRNVPLLVLLLIGFCALLKIIEGTYVTMYVFGLLLSWTYLRFYQHHSNGSKGDMADSFAFHTFFPNVMQPPIAILGRMVFESLVKLRICRKATQRSNFEGSVNRSGADSIAISLPGMERQDSERRRQIALKALSDRLTKVEIEKANDGDDALWPNLESSEKSKKGPGRMEGPSTLHQSDC